MIQKLKVIYFNTRHEYHLKSRLLSASSKISFSSIKISREFCNLDTVTVKRINHPNIITLKIVILTMCRRQISTNKTIFL